MAMEDNKVLFYGWEPLWRFEDVSLLAGWGMLTGIEPTVITIANQGQYLATVFLSILCVLILCMAEIQFLGTQILV